ncbi:MAG TPA: tetratricopeptide repeat protein [Candidatus Methylacidiphilales bacterium]
MPSPTRRCLPSPGLAAAVGLLFAFAPFASAQSSSPSAAASSAKDAKEAEAAAKAKLDPWQEAFVAFKTGDADKAAALCEAALKADSGSARFILLYARALAAQGKTDAAEAAFKKAVLLDPNSASARRLFGDFYFHLRRFDAARPSYQEALHRGADAAELNLLLAYCAVGAGDAGEAERLASGPAFNPFDETTPAYYFAKAAVERMKGHVEEAKPLIQQAETLYGHDLFAQYVKDYIFLFAPTDPKEKGTGPASPDLSPKFQAK